MVLITSIYVCCCLCTDSINTKTPPIAPADPEDVGISSERLERIERMLEKAIENNEIPGAVALVARNGKIVYHKAGIIDAFTNKPITIEENIKKLAALPLHHNPGEKFTYSEGLDVLGY